MRKADLMDRAWELLMRPDTDRDVTLRAQVCVELARELRLSEGYMPAAAAKKDKANDKAALKRAKANGKKLTVEEELDAAFGGEEDLD